MTDRELLQTALDALEDDDLPRYEIRQALRAALAQPNDFSPDWDAMAVMVEEQQRMAKRIEELEAALAQPEPVIQARKEGDLIVVDLPQVPRGSGGISKDTQPEPESMDWMKECADFWNRYTYLNERAQERCEEQAKMWIEKLRENANG